MNVPKILFRPQAKAGFALVVTLSLMVLLAVIAVGMLGLSAISLRTASQTQGVQEARSNARLALMLALGELQASVGSDRAITAPAAIIDSGTGSDLHYTGVWEARQDPREPSSQDALGKTPEYDSSAFFKRWLVSNPDPDAGENENFIQGAGFSDPVEMVGEGSVGDSSRDKVVAGRVGLSDSAGRSRGEYAWWVSENGTKTAVGLRDLKARGNASQGDDMAAFGTPGASGIEILEDLGIEANTPMTDKAMSLSTVGLLSKADGSTISRDELQEKFHDLVASSRSLMSNPTAGGLRKDLSLFFEGQTAEDGSAWTGNLLDGDGPIGPYGLTALSPHSDASGFNDYDTGNWKQLWQHYSTYKSGRRDKGLIEGRGETLTAVNDFDSGNQSHPYPSWNTQRKLIKPVILRYSYVLSVSVQDARLAGATKKDSPLSLLLNSVDPKTKEYDPVNAPYIITFHAYPVATIWNPYNTKLVCDGFAIGNMAMSVDHTVNVTSPSGVTKPVQLQWGHIADNGASGWFVMGMGVPGPVRFDPGEVKMFFATDDYYRQSNNYQYYLKGQEVRDLSRIAFDPAPQPPTSHPFAAGHVKNGIVGDTKVGQDGKFGNVMVGLYAGPDDEISIETDIYTPVGSKNQGSRAEFEGLIYYGTYSSFDVRMITREFDRSSWKTDALHWIRWGGGGESARVNSSKWTNKIGWRNDSGSPIIPDQVVKKYVNVSTLAEGRKEPFMVLDLRFKATEDDAEQNNPNITWLQNIPSHGYAGCSGQTTSGVGVSGAGNEFNSLHSNPYTMVYRTATTASDAWSALQFEQIDNQVKTFMGNSYTTAGQHGAIATEIPLVPLQSIAQFQNLPQVPIDATKWSGLSLQNLAIGNSYPNPNLASDRIKSPGWNVWLDNRMDNADSRTNMRPDLDGKKWYTTTNGQGPASEHFKSSKHLDRSWAANTLLWDDFYFSGLSEYTGDLYGMAKGTDRSLDKVVEDFLARADPKGGDLSESVPNSRYIPYLGDKTAQEVSGDLLGKEGYRKVAAHLFVDGGFNVNSVSKDAWMAVLAGNLKKRQTLLEESGSLGDSVDISEDEYVLNRFGLANGEATDGSLDGNRQWLGHRVIDRSDLEDLAERIVDEVKLRGPFRSLGEFVNRRLEKDTDESLRGALQAAIDGSSINEELNGSSDRIAPSDLSKTNFANERAITDISRHAGTPGWVMQGDLLQSIGSVLQVRSDTFTIRAYGESADGASRAWCEAVVQRYPEWVDSTDEPEEEFVDVSEVNQRFGRRFKMVSFRWLGSGEV